MSSLKKPSASGKAKRKLADISTDVVESDSSSSSSSSSSDPTSVCSMSESEAEGSPVREAGTLTDEPDEPVLSHAEKRRQKKRKLNSGDAAPVDVPESPTKLASKPKKGKGRKGEKPGEISEGGDALPKRQNSVWVGNLAYKTTTVTLKAFFDGLEVTRIHMPMKAPPSGTGPKVNSGFAYVDFGTPDAKLVAITMSERNLEGRRLLIKDGDDFAGRPTATTTPTITTNEDGTTTTTEATTSKPGAPKTGLTKISQKILAAQKQPPGQTLFFGNLGFEATEDSISQLLEAHRKKPAEPTAGDADDEGEDDESKEKSRKEDKWIRKVRMGTFEDSGKCKGWAFVDFTSTEHATAALINPRNHSLDGRKLNVEYASPDAVRRGGGPREADKRGAVGRVRKPKSAGYTRTKPKSTARVSKDGVKQPNKKERKAEKKERKMEKLKHKYGAGRAGGGEGGGDGGGYGRGGPGKGERPKPGAALALAHRETAAILPSQGQKITF